MLRLSGNIVNDGINDEIGIQRLVRRDQHAPVLAGELDVGHTVGTARASQGEQGEGVSVTQLAGWRKGCACWVLCTGRQDEDKRSVIVGSRVHPR